MSIGSLPFIMANVQNPTSANALTAFCSLAACAQVAYIHLFRSEKWPSNSQYTAHTTIPYTAWSPCTKVGPNNFHVLSAPSTTWVQIGPHPVRTCGGKLCSIKFALQYLGIWKAIAFAFPFVSVVPGLALFEQRSLISWRCDFASLH